MFVEYNLFVHVRFPFQTGELQNIMKGDTTGSTRLHLLCGDRLLVGAVHCDKEINELSSRKGVFNHALQVGPCPYILIVTYWRKNLYENIVEKSEIA